MNFNTFAVSLSDLDRCAQARRVTEVLLEPDLLARQGRLSLRDVHELALAARARALRPVLVWDALMPERRLVEIEAELVRLDFSVYAAVRVSDVGAAQWLRNHQPQMPIHLIAETGNHNLTALQGWCDYFGPALERLVLSIELPEEKLIDYCRRLPVGCEVLGVGPILLFYSPRSLLAQHLSPD
ncbi:MAG: U32 family peptidase, partial [Anaerolineae bacterium]|nr:U32 family peptidase [Anaerolineae bacterium]